MKRTKNESPIRQKVNEMKRARRAKTLRRVRAHALRFISYAVLLTGTVLPLYQSFKFYDINTEIVESTGVTFSKYGFAGLGCMVIFIIMGLITFYFNQILRHMDGKSTLLSFDNNNEE